MPPDRLPGAQFLTEIREQPEALRRLVEHDAEFAQVAAAMHKRNARLTRLVGHGSSDNAASYGVYAFGLIPRWTALRDSISLTVYYDSGPDLAGSTVIALSQSGRTPDVVEYVARARASGAFTVALTNEPDSILAETAEAVLPLSAGPEQAVAATKTYTNQVAALASLFPVWAVASDDPTLPAVKEAAERIRAAGATLVASGPAAAALDMADYTLPVPAPSQPLLAPILSVVPGQLFALALATA